MAAHDLVIRGGTVVVRQRVETDAGGEGVGPLPGRLVRGRQAAPAR